MNTGTLGLYAVVVVVHPSARITHRVRAWLTAAGLLLFVLLEVFVFTAVIFESSFLKCNAVDDCPTGTFCTLPGMTGLPHCGDCIGSPQITNDNDENTETPTKTPRVNDDDDGFYDDENTKEPTYATIYYDLTNDYYLNNKTCSALFPPGIWEKRDYALNADYNELPLTPFEEFDWSRDYDKYKCLSANHCTDTDMDAPANDYKTQHCDYIVRNKEKMDVQIWILLLVLSLLWTLSVCQEIEEAAIEEIVLNHHVEDTLNGPAEVVRRALRIRKYLIPLYATSSTIVLLITDTISSKVIILKLLAIGLLLEADNAVAMLFLSNRYDVMMDAVMREVDGSASVAAQGTFFWTRVQGLLCAVILVGAMYRIEQFVRGCDYLYFFLYQIIIIPALMIFTGQFLYSFICARRNGSLVGEEII